MSWILRPFKAIYRWMASVIYVITRAEDDLDDLYPDRHKPSGAEVSTNASITGGMGGGFGGMGGGF